MPTFRQRFTVHLIIVLLLFFSIVATVKATDGWASTWSGPGAATHDCIWPWDDCEPRTVTSLDTGKSITVTPIMYCRCYVPNVPHPHRLIDLSPDQVSALGLNPALGLWRVSVTDSLPDTAVQ